MLCLILVDNEVTLNIDFVFVTSCGLLCQ